MQEKMSPSDIIRLIDVFHANPDLSEITVELGDDFRISVKRHSPANVWTTTPVTASIQAEHAQTPAGPSIIDPGTIIASPMIGTFYAASSPTAEPFVRTGDAIEIGETLCIIEAMKLMNEIEADVAGQIVEILVENGAEVQEGQPLFRIEPS